jgi:hypothetical protein
VFHLFATNEFLSARQIAGATFVCVPTTNDAGFNQRGYWSARSDNSKLLMPQGCDETITLGCLEVKGNIRGGSYSFAMGPRATSNFSMSGIYDIDSDSSMQVIGKDREGKDVKFTTMIYVEDKEYPTQMIVIDEKGDGRFYIWQRKE